MSNTQERAKILAELLPAYDAKKWEEVLNRNSTIKKGAQVAFPMGKRAGVL